jgi:hypothetical protein
LRDIGKNGAGPKHSAQYLGKENKPRSAFIRAIGLDLEGCLSLVGCWIVGILLKKPAKNIWLKNRQEYSSF